MTVDSPVKKNIYMLSSIQDKTRHGSLQYILHFLWVWQSLSLTEVEIRYKERMIHMCVWCVCVCVCIYI
jgi:hypothetical protein